MVPLSVILHCLNEERNIEFALKSVADWADQVFVVDSGSTDSTLSIAKKYTRLVFQRYGGRESLVDLRNWALDNLPIGHEWVFILDADEMMPEDLKSEVARLVENNDPSKDGYWCRFKLYFMGRWIRRASMYPTWTLRLFRREKVRYERREVNSHPLVEPGRAGHLTNHILNQDRRGFPYYIRRMDEFSSLESQAYVKVRMGGQKDRLLAGRLRGSPAERRRYLKNLFVRLPMRPALIFFYLYFVRGGLFDGRAGFDYCVLKAVGEWMITVKIKERPCDSRPSTVHQGDSKTHEVQSMT